MDIIIITAGKRPELFRQTVDSARHNAADKTHSLTIVIDGFNVGAPLPIPNNAIIIQAFSPVGASAARNIGASSIPKYRRSPDGLVMFLDDDVYLVKGWDFRLKAVAVDAPSSILSGHGHPFNHEEPAAGGVVFGVPLVISTVQMAMPWALWDEVGYFAEPGGPGGSEDFDYCMRAKAKGYGFAITHPHTAIHCGVMSSSGKPIVGYDQVVAHNDTLLKQYGLEEKVIFQ